MTLNFLTFFLFAAQIVHDPGLLPQYANFRGKDYVLANVHFHTGVNNYEGSNHPLFGQRFPLEVHAAYYQPQFGHVRDALNTGIPDAVLIIATLYQVGILTDELSCDYSFYEQIGEYNPAMQKVVENLPYIAVANTSLSLIHI